MKSRAPRVVLALLCLAAAVGVAVPSHAEPAGPDAVPAGLRVPGGRAPDLTLTARGVQIYECRPVAGEAGRYEWAFRAPEADLFDAAGRPVGRHYAGPTWETNDGGKVVGKLKAKAEAPDGRGVPWLLLDAAESSGPGVLGKTAHIQRILTAGGLPPAEPADAAHAGQLRRVDYTATYLFYLVQP